MRNKQDGEIEDVYKGIVLNADRCSVLTREEWVRVAITVVVTCILLQSASP
jgi:hypothetical protein